MTYDIPRLKQAISRKLEHLDVYSSGFKSMLQDTLSENRSITMAFDRLLVQAIYDEALVQCLEKLLDATGTQHQLHAHRENLEQTLLKSLVDSKTSGGMNVWDEIKFRAACGGIAEALLLIRANLTASNF